MVAQTPALRRNTVIRGAVKALGLTSAIAGVVFSSRADMKRGELSTIDSGAFGFSRSRKADRQVCLSCPSWRHYPN